MSEIELIEKLNNYEFERLINYEFMGDKCVLNSQEIKEILCKFIGFCGRFVTPRSIEDSIISMLDDAVNTGYIVNDYITIKNKIEDNRRYFLKENISNLKLITEMYPKHKIKIRLNVPNNIVKYLCDAFPENADKFKDLDLKELNFLYDKSITVNPPIPINKYNVLILEKIYKYYGKPIDKLIENFSYICAGHFYKSDICNNVSRKVKLERILLCKDRSKVCKDLEDFSSNPSICFKDVNRIKEILELPLNKNKTIDSTLSNLFKEELDPIRIEIKENRCELKEKLIECKKEYDDFNKMEYGTYTQCELFTFNTEEFSQELLNNTILKFQIDHNHFKIINININKTDEEHLVSVIYTMELDYNSMKDLKKKYSDKMETIIDEYNSSIEDDSRLDEDYKDNLYVSSFDWINCIEDDGKMPSLTNRYENMSRSDRYSLDKGRW